MSHLNLFKNPAAACFTVLAGLSAAAPALAAPVSLFTPVLGLAPAGAQPLAPLSSADLVIDMAAVSSFGALGDPLNTVLRLAAQPGAVVDVLSWTLSLSTFGASWLSEAAFVITNSNGDGVLFNPGNGDDAAGAKEYIDSFSLVSLGLGLNVLADGKLFVEFYEYFDDNAGSADARYVSGRITLNGIGAAAAVPEPGTYALVALGLFGAALTSGRRRQG